MNRKLIGEAAQLWVAQGFGVGRIPFAPGTFGSLVGLLWFALLLSSGSVWIFAGGTVAGIALSIRLCGSGERILKQKDPGSVILDEIVAIPVCFFAWIVIWLQREGIFPTLENLFGGQKWIWGLGVFVAFRVFDVAKPWPVRQSQALPGGWGITIDDVLAAVYVNLIILLVYGVSTMLAK